MNRHFANNSIFELGFGAMPLSLAGKPNIRNTLTLLNLLEESPIQLIDTALGYGLDEQDIGHNERLIGHFIKKSIRKDWIIATKGGTWRNKTKWVVDGHPKSIRKACETSLRNLRIDTIDLYQLHAIDHKIPLLESLGEFSKLQEEGKIKSIGVSNVNYSELKEAHDKFKVSSVQNELNFFKRGDFENGIIDYCEKFKITYLAHSPVGGYLHYQEIHSHPIVQKFAEQFNLNTFELMLSWLLSRSKVIIPIPGARRPQSFRSIISASSISFRQNIYEEFERLTGEIF